MSMKRQFLSSDKSTVYHQLKENKIELLNCRLGAGNCKESLSIINKCYVDAHCYRLDKDYLNSIDSLKSAFFSTCDLKEDTCKKCAEFFRMTIKQSLENINGELYELTNGFIGNKSYQLSYITSSDFLQDIKKNF